MPNLNQRGVAHILLLLLLVAGIIVGVYLVQNRTNLLPKAAISKPIGPETSFSLVGPSGCTAGWLCVFQGYEPLEEFGVKLYVRSDIETANLFTAKINFPKDLVEVKEIRTEGSFITNWVENYYGDNNDGITVGISLVGGVPSPGFQTQLTEESALMASIIFRAKSVGKGQIYFTDSSAILSNLNNINILTVTRPYEISVEIKPSPTPVPSPTLPPPTLVSRVFVTSTTYNGNLGGPLGADTKCQDRANAVNLGGVWKAWISGRLANGEYQTAESRLNHSTWPYTLLNGKVIAKNWDYLTHTNSSQYGPLQNPINVTETQESFPDVTDQESFPESINYWNVWTNTWASGSNYESQASLNCNEWTSNSSTLTGRGGTTAETSYRWTASEYAAHSCDTLHRLYCFEQNPSPTPSPTQTPVPTTKGDGNSDGKINLVDMSVIHTDWMKSKDMVNFRDGIDMNDDGLINTFDFALHRKLLLELGVIRTR